MEWVHRTIRHDKLKMEWVHRTIRHDKLKMDWVHLDMISLKWSGYN